jgi:hypothetical protein
MSTKFYTNLYEIDDHFRKKKYLQLLISSLQNDLSKWTQEAGTSTKYVSPNYNGSQFVVVFQTYSSFAYISHSTPPIKDRYLELISEELTKELNNEMVTLRATVYTPEIYELEKLIGNKHTRKEKLDSLEIEQVKEVIQDTYDDWLMNQTQATGELIAKLIYSYRKNKDIYDIWIDTFKDVKEVNEELQKITG